MVALNLTLMFALFLPLLCSAGRHAHRTTNADRLSRGLPPLPPRRFYDGSLLVREPRASSTPLTCTTGQMDCCVNVFDTQNELVNYMDANGHASDGGELSEIHPENAALPAGGDCTQSYNQLASGCNDGTTVICCQDWVGFGDGYTVGSDCTFPA